MKSVVLEWKSMLSIGSDDWPKEFSIDVNSIILGGFSRGAARIFT